MVDQSMVEFRKKLQDTAKAMVPGLKVVSDPDGQDFLILKMKDGKVYSTPVRREQWLE